MLYNLAAIKQEQIRCVQEIERTAYPEFMQQFQDMSKLSDILEYAEMDYISSVYLLVTDNFYAVFSRHINKKGQVVVEFVDLAKKPRTKVDWWLILRTINTLKPDVLKMDCRASTSYKRTLAFLELIPEALTVKKQKDWYWEDEKMVELAILVNRTSKQYQELVKPNWFTKLKLATRAGLAWLTA